MLTFQRDTTSDTPQPHTAPTHLASVQPKLIGHRRAPNEARFEYDPTLTAQAHDLRPAAGTTAALELLDRPKPTNRNHHHFRRARNRRLRRYATAGDRDPRRRGPHQQRQHANSRTRPSQPDYHHPSAARSSSPGRPATPTAPPRNHPSRTTERRHRPRRKKKPLSPQHRNITGMTSG